MSHYEERLANDLEHINASVRAMAGLVERALKDAMHALLDGDAQLANLTVLRDNRINRASRELDRLCHAFIARHLPGAGHLRLISAVIRLNVALERIGDYAVTISRESLQLSSPPAGHLARELDRVADESRRILHQAIEVFDSRNADAAAATIPMSENIENMMDDVYAELIGTESSRSPREIVAAFVVFSLLKRISDQGKNICEQTLFAVTGHTKKTKTFNILFVDGDDCERSLMAQGIGRKSYPEAASYSSAAREPRAEMATGLADFLDSCGIDAGQLVVGRLRAGQHELQEYDIIVSLSGPVSSHIEEIPFHTSAIEWPVGSDLTGSGGYEDLYRYLKQQIDELIDVLAGEG
ncbi:MAG: phosphate signaling complex protein PhoU [Gammaproteobacteria bacterium]|nr:phosphate signaling complex protein PhoU [Gammaproteobacteria bacterium]NNF60032.1 phosphate signaling complex protein PhoU [Gammaproteobacteria bacterium]NNM19963.1 phosphate signaling complex protein PhoU [Gammaproteobacteria bacterium]